MKDGNERVFVGFLEGRLVTSHFANHSRLLPYTWAEKGITNWKIKGAK